MRAHTHTFYDYIICEQPVQLNGKNVCVLLALLHWVTYRPEETGLTEPTFSNSWAFAATLKNNFKMQVSLKSIRESHSSKRNSELAVNQIKK